MDIRRYFQNCFLVIFLISIQKGFCQLDDDYEDGPASVRCPWIRNKLKNGRVRYRYKGRVAKFLCDSGYELAGKRSSTCVRGQWSNPIPVCVARGCNRVPSIANGRVTEMYRGALLMYDCNPGYVLTGDVSIHCDGRRWNASPPLCEVNSAAKLETSCDFESPYLCGWTHDQTHDFDWKRNHFATPSGHVGTGPSYDHTFGENKAGYYLYIEASSPRKINDTARLFSPVYPAQESGGCFLFWYHMYGATTGGLRVYFKPESYVFGELSPKWEKFGDQGNQWLRGNISVPTVRENFQIIIEGIRGESYVGDSAIDDVQLTQTDCQAIENSNETTTEVTADNSCRGRCQTSPIEGSCECKEICVAADSCCSDYITLCIDGNESIESHLNEPDPGDYYGKTTSPLTVPDTSSLSTTEAQTSNALLDVSSNLTSQSFTTLLSSTTIDTNSTSTFIPETVHSSSSTSTLIPTTVVMTTLSTDTTSLAQPSSTMNSNIETKSTLIISPITTVVTETTPRKFSATNSVGTTKTTPKEIPITSRQVIETSSVKPSPKTTSIKSTRPRLKTTNIPTSSLATTLISTTSTITTTTSKISTTTTPLTTTQISTSTTPMSTTQISTSTTPMTTTQSSTSTISETTTKIATTQSSATNTPISTTTVPSSTSTIPTTLSTTTKKPFYISIAQTNPTSSSVLTTVLPSTALSSSTISDTTTTTRRYNFRPRYRTSLSTSTISHPATTYYSTISPSAAITTSTSKTQTSTISSAVSRRTLQTRRWFTFTKSPTAAITSANIPTSTQRVPILVHRTKTTPFVFSSSFPTTSDSYEMVASKTETTKSNGSSSIIICVAVFIIICIIVGVLFYIRRNNHKRLSKLDDDSEMRFLPESDYMDYSDASALDRILVK